MPAQTAEACRALFKAGRNDLSVELLEAVAMGSTLYTEAPGNFPERMNFDGKGEYNYIFGNPIGSFAYSVIGGLFGISHKDDGECFVWNPSLPAKREDASLNLPYASVIFKKNEEDGKVYNKYTFSTKREEKRFILSFIFSYAFISLRQNEYWSSPVVFCKRTLIYSPYNYKIYSLLGNAYVREKEYDKAITACNNSIKINPSFPYSYFNFGLVYMDLRQFDEAIEYFQTAITKNPEFINAYNNIAVCYFEMGKFDEAIGISKKIIDINPNYTRAYYNIVLLYSFKGEKDEADKYERKLEKLGHTMAEQAFEANAK